MNRPDAKAIPGRASADRAGRIPQWLRQLWLPLLFVLVVGFMPLVVAKAMTLKTITIDGNFDDWDSVLADKQNILYDSTGTGDGDTPTAARNLGRIAYTWDATNVYFYMRTADELSAATDFYVYIDRNENGTLDAGDVIVSYNFNGGKVWADPSTMYAYVPASTNDTITGDGPSPQPGTFGTQLIKLTKPGGPQPTWDLEGACGNRFAGSTKKLYFEMRVKWSALGVPAGTALSFHFANGNPSPSGISDNAGPGTGGTSSTRYTTLDIYPDRQNGVQPSSVATFSHTLVQSGNITDTVSISAFTDNGWPVSVLTSAGPVTSVQLRGTETTSLALQVTVPATATPNSVEQAYVRVRSTYDTSVVDAVTDQMYVGPLVIYPARTSNIVAGDTVRLRCGQTWRTPTQRRLHRPLRTTSCGTTRTLMAS